MYTVLSFTPSKGAKSDSEGRYGYVSVKGYADNPSEAEELLVYVTENEEANPKESVGISYNSEYFHCEDPSVTEYADSGSNTPEDDEDKYTLSELASNSELLKKLIPFLGDLADHLDDLHFSSSDDIHIDGKHGKADIHVETKGTVDLELGKPENQQVDVTIKANTDITLDGKVKHKGHPDLEGTGEIHIDSKFVGKLDVPTNEETESLEEFKELEAEAEAGDVGEAEAGDVGEAEAGDVGEAEAGDVGEASTETVMSTSN